MDRRPGSTTRARCSDSSAARCRSTALHRGAGPGWGVSRQTLRTLLAAACVRRDAARGVRRQPGARRHVTAGDALWPGPAAGCGGHGSDGRLAARCRRAAAELAARAATRARLPHHRHPDGSTRGVTAGRRGLLPTDITWCTASGSRRALRTALDLRSPAVEVRRPGGHRRIPAHRRAARVADRGDRPVPGLPRRASSCAAWSRSAIGRAESVGGVRPAAALVRRRPAAARAPDVGVRRPTAWPSTASTSR